MKKLIVLLVFWIGLVSSAWAFDMNAQLSTPPSYQFQSTSTCLSVVGNSTFTTTTVYAPGCSSPSGASRPRRSLWDEEDEEGNPSGEGVGNVDTPVGEPMVLLLLALGYLLVKVESGKRKVERSSKVES